MNRLALLLVVAGCSAEASSSLPQATGGTFIAFERDFQSFRSWHRFALPHTGAQGITHIAGRRAVYINIPAAAGADRFPVGTMIVKEIEAPELPGHQMFAMVKRGVGYNVRGAPGWEWFELQRRASGGVGIVWRGVNAPVGEAYGGDPLGGCNSCHETSVGNDFVMSKPLALRPR